VGFGGLVWGVGVRPPTPHPQNPNPQSPIPNPQENINKSKKLINNK